MTEKGHKFSLTIVSGKSFCSTTFFIFSVSFIAKLVVNKFEGLKLRKENIEKEHQVAQFYFAWGLFFHQVLLLCVYFLKNDNIGLKLYKRPELFMTLSFSPVLSASWSSLRHHTRSHYCRSCRETSPVRGAPHTLQRVVSWREEGSCWQRRRALPLVSETHAGVSGNTTGPLLNLKAPGISFCPVQARVTSQLVPQWSVFCRDVWPELSLPLLSSPLAVLSAGTDCPSLKNTKIRFTCQNKTRKILSVLFEEVKQGELVALKTIPLDLKDVD